MLLPDPVTNGTTTYGRVHSVETCGSVDGPGLRYVIFLSGCPLRCVYCHNPDTQDHKCGTYTSADEVVAQALRYRNFIRKGGITISGGEPLLQPEFVKAVFQSARRAGLHTALDTCGFVGDRADDELLQSTDLVLLDIKSWNPALYKSVTGVKLEPTLRFARRLSDMGKAMWIRFVLVPGLTDGEENMRGLAGFIKTLDCVERVEILPFHKFGESKHQIMGTDYQLMSTPAATAEDVARAKAIFAEEGVAAI